ncbi:MAG: hypothetical protein IPJ65_29310 [Archangiaceae bacterium]|nr:hypothetical protein [Archangiaceae bacterium]
MSKLLEALQEDPRDLRAYQVFADELMARGDPWGELIGLMCSLEGEKDPGRFLERKRAAEKLRAELEPRLLESLAFWSDALQCEWKWGVVRAVKLGRVPIELHRAVSALFEAPALAVLQELTAWQTEYHGGGDFVQLVALIAGLAPKSLKALKLGGMGDAAVLLSAHPQLESLELMSAEGDYAVREPKLSQLRLAQCGGAAFEWLVTARWPELVALEHTGSGRDVALAEGLTRARFPKLNELRGSCDSCDVFLGALDPEVLGGLSVLELYGEFSDLSLEALIAARTRLAKAKRVVLRGLPTISRRLHGIVKKQLPMVQLIRD